MSDEQPLEYRKWVHELKRRDAERAHDQDDTLIGKLNDAAIFSGQAALRAALLVNGAAAAAILAFIGSLVSADWGYGAHLGTMAASLMWFAWGVAAAVMGMGFAYLTNHCFGALNASRERIWEHPYIHDGASTWRWKFATGTFQVLSVIAGLISIVLFITGMLDVEGSIGLLPPQEPD